MNRVVQRWWRPVWLGLTIAGFGLGIFYVVALGEGNPVEARAYFDAPIDDMYERSLVMEPGGAYLYSPAFRQAIEPLVRLGWPAFLVIWRVLNLVALTFLAGPLTIIVLFLPPVASELNAGNIHLLLASAVVLAIRRPASWSPVLLTKVTPGIGLLWHAPRGEWRALTGALVATALIVVVSLLLDARAWFEWFRVLVSNLDASPGELPISHPLWLRATVAAGMVLLAARANWPALLPIAAMLALPVIWFHSLSMLVGVIPLLLPPLSKRLRPPSTSAVAPHDVIDPSWSRLTEVDGNDPV